MLGLNVQHEKADASTSEEKVVKSMGWSAGCGSHGGCGGENSSAINA
jgi:hypothetical protein